MAKFNNWEVSYKELTKELGREPSSQEVQNKMVQEDFSDDNKITSKKYED